MIALLLALIQRALSARGPAVESHGILEARKDCFMKRLLIGAVMIGGIAGQLAAQPNSPGSVVVISAGGAELLLGSPNLSWWDNPSCGRPAGRNGDKGFGYWGYACDPLYANNNVNGYPAPSVTVAIPQVVAALPARPPEPPIRPEVHEYNWPSSPSDSSAASFSIVSKDGRVQSAIAVWAQDDTLCYVTPDGSESRMPIDSIDRQATLQRNVEKQLNICLPAD
jgi:hypothetical protein